MLSGCRSMKYGGMVLAAGASRRMGTPKQLLRISGEMLLERALRICRDAGCNPIVVVLGASADQVKSSCPLEDAIVVVNKEWQEGMSSSIAMGISALDDGVDGCVITTCDMPAVSAHHLRKLAKAGQVTASAYAGRSGVPAFFPRSIFPRLTMLRGDMGARSLLLQAPSIPLEGGELDIDTPQDLERAIELFS
ncbi:MAG TPA: nucleotidyltransferase family protein [Edaphobacter sp.]|nr:nucleotidyltransferase family protein [Edaphobacter sp.]